MKIRYFSYWNRYRAESEHIALKADLEDSVSNVRLTTPKSAKRVDCFVDDIRLVSSFTALVSSFDAVSRQ